jgi:hypothetical protein
MRLSHSSKEMYLTCSKKWELHYKERLRTSEVGSALFFGNAIDEALNVMLLEKKKNLTDSDKLMLRSSPEKTFEHTLRNVYVLDKYIDVSKYEHASYYKSDFDLTLLENLDLQGIYEYAEVLELDVTNLKQLEKFLDFCHVEVKNKLEKPEKLLYNFVGWISLLKKGLLLIQEYRENILPEIEEVFDVQKEIRLDDGDDCFVGVIDVICSFNDEPGKVYICDNKTSTRAYKKDSVRTSPQLAAYCEHEDVKDAAYIVLEKNIRKKDPRVRSAIIKDTVPEKLKDETFDILTEVLHNIKEEKFDKNFDSCFAYGKKCPYFDYCRTGSYVNLKKLDKKE